MATLGTPRRSGPPRSLWGAAYYRVMPYGVVASRWPRSRGMSRVPAQRAQQELFRVLARIVRVLRPEEVQVMRDALKESLARHPEVKKTSAIRERDIWYRLLTGRGWGVTVPGYPRLKPMALVRDVSDLLDWLCPWYGGLVVRGADRWMTVQGCRPLSVLMCTPDMDLGTCCPGPSIPPPDKAIGGR